MYSTRNRPLSLYEPRIIGLIHLANSCNCSNERALIGSIGGGQLVSLDPAARTENNPANSQWPYFITLCKIHVAHRAVGRIDSAIIWFLEAVRVRGCNLCCRVSFHMRWVERMHYYQLQHYTWWKIMSVPLYEIKQESFYFQGLNLFYLSRGFYFIELSV